MFRPPIDPIPPPKMITLLRYHNHIWIPAGPPLFFQSDRLTLDYPLSTKRYLSLLAQNMALIKPDMVKQ